MNSTNDNITKAWDWVSKLWEVEEEDAKITRKNNGQATILNIRVKPETKNKFKSIFYTLKADGIINTQEELIRGLIRLYETKRRILIKTLNREFR